MSPVIHRAECDGPECDRSTEMVFVSIWPGWLVPHGWTHFDKGETFCCGNCVRAFFGVHPTKEWEYSTPPDQEPPP